MPKRSEKEEKYLWQRLKEIDIEMAREEKRAMKKKAKVVASARRKMGVGKEQPSILESLRIVSGKISPSVEGGGSVNTLTGSVSVADSQSNTVTPEASLEHQIPGDSLRTDASLVENASLEVNSSQMRSAKISPEKLSAHAHPISPPWESSEAFARMGLVADGVGPKKPKTSEHQQPRPAVEPLLGGG